ncbi:DUF262 domain-containing protein [uncultured Mailhella sp.]|uniref:DUF262 domain-containing protein n=1 Tax=uncultured Mailhella sp. TaxID=1981031 RepID=UPI0025CB9BC7|nr:DUF262 domain-containing protein [uncultured Mailhella sp.]
MTELEREIEKYKKEIHSDAYPMSIGEAVSMYQNGELEIHPEFQRVFRWSKEQKSKFIESILLGIPIPSFFVSQRDDGVWDLVDGLQRFSSILSFMGELKDENGNKLDPLVLEKGDYLLALDKVSWNDEEKFTKAMKLSFRREKIDFKIIKKESTKDTKFDLFKRINTGGSPLTDQEVRNCLLIMTNKDFYDNIYKLSKNDNFINSISISDDKMLEQYHLELIIRFIVFYKIDWKRNVSLSIDDVAKFLDAKIIEIANNVTVHNEIFDVFKRTFYIINNVMGEDAFRKFYPNLNRHKGGFSIAIFEAVSVGIAKNINFIEKNDNLKELINNFSTESDFTSSSGAGIRANSRVVKTIPFAIEYFNER